MKYAGLVFVVLAGCLGVSSGEPGEDGAGLDTCAFDVDANYFVTSEGSAEPADAAPLWNWRSADCAREQLQVVCRGSSVDVVCTPCDGHCGTTTQTWTKNGDGSATFEQIDSVGEVTSSRLRLRRAY